jgi:transposase-like protein
MLRSYLRRIRRAGAMGAVHVEVRIGEAKGGSARRIDAVRFPQLDNRIRRYRREEFFADLPGSSRIELIEVKSELDRTIIGQLVAAAELAHEEWGLRPSRKLRLVALVVEVDASLESVCRTYGIRIEQVRYPWRQLERTRGATRDR